MVSKISPSRYTHTFLYVSAEAKQQLENGDMGVSVLGYRFQGRLDDVNFGKQGKITCPDLFNADQEDVEDIHLPLELGDSVEWEVVNEHEIRILAVRRENVGPPHPLEFDHSLPLLWDVITNKPNLVYLTGRLENPATADDIPRGVYMVYLLAFNGRLIVCGHGQFSRACILFDDETSATKSHLKSLLVRIHHRFAPSGIIERYVIRCESKAEAIEIEDLFHETIGGNANVIPAEYHNRLMEGLDREAQMVLRMALHSAFSGLRDLKKWRREGIITDQVWNAIEERLGQW